ncbi:hypothetical protein M902_1962 [Bacteriovorax sp. BAL6_X]|uniref:hypothetical protein n=1 Tax=Bacteriovorax sp. BAL6_X TaxID=1201290 RepID=UPI0003862815|nr:hypothetical protein [Bacteriovorax sp. BAL6_X]EPZ52351.1 hypothetical protein M902_1962 [Bacteriovorax sp. BAL6_X]
MLKYFKTTLPFLIAFTSFSGQFAQAKSLTDKQVINEYMKLHRKQYKTTCSMKIYNESQKLYKNFLGNGIFIPFQLSGDLDEGTIKEYVPLMKKKREWIKGVNERLSKMRSFRNVLARNRQIQTQFEKAMRHNYKYRYIKDLKTKSQVALESKKEIKQFLKDLERYLNSLFFLQSFNFPVDHLHLRSEYDKVKDIETAEGKQKSNSAYLLRKIVEDGSVDPKKGRSDLGLRSLIDSVYLRIVGFDQPFLTEDLRYDISDLISRLDGVLRKGHKKTYARTKYWQKKIIEREDYYLDLLNKSKTKDDILKKIFEDKNQARYALSQYIYDKEALVYKFWKRQKEIYRKLYALETILIHEVGRLDDNYGSERRDVAKVVINRVTNPGYNTIESDEPFYQSLVKAGVKNTEKYPWLNVLFKRGQFSFTYFFIPASKGIFCPDQSKSARKLMRKNLKIILDELHNPDKDFKATRYFSRASMLGRMDMSSLWDEYTSMEERPGPLIHNTSRLKTLLTRKNLNYLYSFKDSGEHNYDVYRYKNKVYVYSATSDKFYQYRNPHYFKYFVKDDDY